MDQNGCVKIENRSVNKNGRPDFLLCILLFAVQIIVNDEILYQFAWLVAETRFYLYVIFGYSGNPPPFSLLHISFHKAVPCTGGGTAAFPVTGDFPD